MSDTLVDTSVSVTDLAMDRSCWMTLTVRVLKCPMISAPTHDGERTTVFMLRMYPYRVLLASQMNTKVTKFTV